MRLRFQSLESGCAIEASSESATSLQHNPDHRQRYCLDSYLNEEYLAPRVFDVLKMR